MATEPGKRRNPRKAKAQVEDAEIVAETSLATDAATESSEPDAEPVVLEEPAAEPATETPADLPAEAPAEVAEAEPTPEPEPEPEPQKEPESPVKQQAAPPPAPQSSGFIPMVLGGLIAGGIGYGIATLQYPETDSTVYATADDVAALSAQIADLPPPADTAPLTDGITALQARMGDLDSSLGEIGNRIDALDSRLVVVERQPNADGTLTDTALAAFEADLQGLRDQLSAQAEEMRQMTEQTTERLDETRQEAVAIEQNAIEAARNATARAALARVQGALETGAPFDGVLVELESALGTAPPEAIAAVSAGAPTLVSLQGEFANYARQALNVARSEGVDGETRGGLTSFLRNQLDVRSVVPQDGDNVDAILSRAEAALRDGRLNDTLAELGGLPEVARAAMSDWLAQAEARAAAIDAADTLATQLTTN